VSALDAEAVRERVRARLQLVEDGDYFALLGVPRDATGYELRRAFLELRRAFDPSRVLTTEVSDLADDVRKIATVLEEAYDILKDAARRERYRRAIDAVPE
jgi:curved DNA-binding protein CbpA